MHDFRATKHLTNAETRLGKRHLDKKGFVHPPINRIRWRLTVERLQGPKEVYLFNLSDE